MSQIINQLHSGSSSISKNDDEEVHMVLGLTGAGKTTLTAYLSGIDLVIKQEKLESYKSISDKKYDSDDSSDDEEDSNADRSKNYLDYKTRLWGYGKIGGSDLESETIFPNKFVSQTGSIFWDCPGFQDSRGEEIDIANSNYIRRISQNAQKIKFVLVIDGSCLEQKGFGSNKGDPFKVLLETLFQMSKDTTIDYSEQLCIIITRVNKSKKKKYFKQKLEKLFTDLLEQESFIQKLSKFFKKPDFEKFLDKLKQSKVCLFRQPKGKEGDAFSDKYRKRIQNQLDKTKFYTGVNISTPHSIRSLETLIDLWKYTRSQLSSKFKKLCESFSSDIQQMRTYDCTKICQLIKEFEFQSKNNPLHSNSQFLSAIKNLFFTPLTKIFDWKYKIRDESKEIRKCLMEDIEFFLVKVYDELLLGVRLSSQTEEFFGKISYYELQEGFSELNKSIQ